MTKSALDLQLHNICQASGAKWAVWLERLPAGWNLCASCHLSAALKSALLAYLRQPPIDAWLSGAIASQRRRVRSVPSAAKLNCARVCAFPDASRRFAILAGAEEFSVEAARLWEALAAGHPTLAANALPEVTLPAVAIPDLGSVSYDLGRALSSLLDALLRSVGCQGGWLAVRSGDMLEIKAQAGCPECKGIRLPLDRNSILRKISQGRLAQFLERGQLEWKMLPLAGPGDSAAAWAGLPLVIGQRFIGLAALWRDRPFESGEQELLRRLAARAAVLVDESVTFSSLTDHLRRLALLNDFAITVSSALDLEQVAQRVFALLRRAFGKEFINLILISPDGEMLHHYYYDSNRAVVVDTRPADELPVLRPVHRGEVFRSDDVRIRPGYVTVYENVCSSLVVPMKFRRQVIGSLGLESAEPAAFSVYDEHLLMVIASHLAGLIENGRLRQEAEARARNLSLIHEVVEQVIGARDVHQVAQTAAELVARNFAYEMAAVALLEGAERQLVMAGIGGSAAAIVQQGLQRMVSPRRDGIIHRVATTGASMLIGDVGREPVYRPIPGWDAGSEMCVPLRDGERILGVLDVESQRKNAFSQSDLLMLESLAGILASVISNAGQYQELQSTVGELQAAREELQQRIAAQRAAESRLIQAAKLAAVGEMAAGIAHELNNPLTTVAGFTELVLDELPADSPARTDLELVLREANRARSVVLRLLDFARQGEMRRVRADLNEILADVLALTSHLMHTSGITLQTDFAAKLTWISMDRNQMKQVFLNLVHNAIHAMPEGGKLSVRTAMRSREERQWVTAAIGDTGMGIPPEHLSRIFEPFFTTRSKSGGTGLGLSVSYGIVTDHGGFIEVSSEVRKGSEFTVWLPVEVE